VFNLAYFYAAMLIYATMNISVPLIIFYETNKIKSKIKKYVKNTKGNKTVRNELSTLHTAGNANEMTKRYYNV